MYKRSLRILFFLILLFLAIVYHLRVYAWEVDETPKVNWIQDGDTFKSTSETWYRLADIDTPEEGESGYSAAKNALSSKILNKKIYLDIDDIYIYDYQGTGSRKVCVVYVRYNETHRLNVNKYLWKEGYANKKNFDNEFNPSTWTLYVQYYFPPPDPDPEPESNPEPEQEPEPDQIPDSPDPPTNIPPIVVINGPYGGQEDQELQFSSEGSNDVDGFIFHNIWDFGDGIISNEDNPHHTYTKSGNYTVVLTLTDNTSGSNSSKTYCIITAKQNQRPIPFINGPYEGIVNTNITFLSTGSNDPDGYIILYIWSFGDGATSDKRNPAHAYAEDGNYIVTLSVIDSEGLSTLNHTTCLVRISLGAVRIQVKDENNSQSLSGVYVKSSLTPTGQGTLWGYTDEDGLVEFTDIRNGHYVFCATRDGFVSEEVSVYVIENVSMPRSIRISENETQSDDGLLDVEPQPEPQPELANKGLSFDPILIIPIITIGGGISLILLMRLRERARASVVLCLVQLKAEYSS